MSDPRLASDLVSAVPPVPVTVPATERTRLHREPERGVFDRSVVHSIIDAAPFCHLGFTDPDGTPVVIPTVHARIGDRLVLHGSVAGRAMRTAGRAPIVCCEFSLIDGIVVARSGFWSSINYRSVLVFGEPTPIVDEEEKLVALDAIVDHLLPGRSEEVRRPTHKELAATAVIALQIDETSAKVRAGDPNDDPADLDGDAWAGVLPVRLVTDLALPAANLRAGIAVPASVERAARV